MNDKPSVRSKILEKLSESSLTRKQLIESISASISAIDHRLRELQREGLISYQILDARKNRPIGMGAFALEPNPKVRLYSLVDQKQKSFSDFSKSD